MRGEAFEPRSLGRQLVLPMRLEESSNGKKISIAAKPIVFFLANPTK
jgi:hypothetical protein